jgi:CRP-like cAMP-binding protein
LAALPHDALQRLLGDLELVNLSLGQVLCESGIVSRYVYFPTTAIVSLTYVLEDGHPTGIALIGNEGVVGISQFLGDSSTPMGAVVQSAGKCMRLSAESIKEEFKRLGPFMHVLLRYTQALIAQMTQTAVCNRYHSIEQQLCLWLLQSLDRVNAPELLATHELIADMLGVRREGISKAAAKLQNAGLIRYSRGVISVVGRARIEGRVCECYSVVRKEYERLIPKFVEI